MEMLCKKKEHLPEAVAFDQRKETPCPTICNSIINIISNGLPTNLTTGKIYKTGDTMIVGTNKGLAISNDNGVTFSTRTRVDNGLASDCIHEIFVNEQSIFVATAHGLSISKNGGTSFATPKIADLSQHKAIYDVFVTGSGPTASVYVATDDGLAASSDGGNSFAMATSFPTQSVYAKDNLVVAGRQNEGLDISYDNGITFEPRAAQSTGIPEGRVTNVFIQYGVIYLSLQLASDAQASSLHISNDSGNSFQVLSTPFDSCIFDFAICDNDIFLTAASGLFISRDAGRTFTKAVTSSTGQFRGIHVNGQCVYLSGLGVYESNDAGINFRGIFANGLPGNNIQSILIQHRESGDFPEILVGTDHGLASSLDGGKSFYFYSDVFHLAGEVINGIAREDSGKYWIATNRGLSRTDLESTCKQNYTSRHRLGDNFVRAVAVSRGTTVFAATDNGLSRKGPTDLSFDNRTKSHGLGSNVIRNVYVLPDPASNNEVVYAATDGGLGISVDGGFSFVNKTATNSGLGSDLVKKVLVAGGTVYVATNNCLAISRDQCRSFVVKTVASGLGSNLVRDVCVTARAIYVATSAGLAVSTDNGLHFDNITIANGLGSNDVRAIVAYASTVYAATANGLAIITSNDL